MHWKKIFHNIYYYFVIYLILVYVQKYKWKTIIHDNNKLKNIKTAIHKGVLQNKIHIINRTQFDIIEFITYN